MKYNRDTNEYRTTDTVKKNMKECADILNLEDRITLLENTHTLTRWLVEHTGDPVNRERYLGIHDDVVNLYFKDTLEYIKDLQFIAEEEGFKTKYIINKLNYKECEDYLKGVYTSSMRTVQVQPEDELADYNEGLYDFDDDWEEYDEW